MVSVSMLGVHFYRKPHQGLQVYNIKHLLFDCDLTKNIWNDIYNMCGLKITYRKIVIGLNGNDDYTMFLNYFISVVTYSIYKSYIRELDCKKTRTFDSMILTIQYDLKVRRNVYFKNYWKTYLKLI